MRYKLSITILCAALVAGAQQTILYNQYTLANPILNPAYAGSHNKWEFLGGYHRQWADIDFSPVSNFFNVLYTHRGNFNYSGSHGFGLYIEQERRGMFSTKSFYLSYAYHIRLNSGYKLGFGLFAGTKRESLLSSAFNSADPALLQTKNIYLYPDVIPGFRLYSKKIFFDLSVRQLYKNKMKQGNKQIGTDSRLIPHIYLTGGYKWIPPNKDFLVIPTVHIQSSVKTLPLVNFGILAYYVGRIGLGANYTVRNSFTTMLHVRLTKESILGISYNTYTSAIRFVSPNNVEIIFGFTPRTADDDAPGKRNVARCPNFDF